MLRSKHSGWTWEGKRTPFGNGGGSFFSPITDPISNVLGTDGGNGGLVGILQGAGNSVANAGAGDWATENGWMIPLAMAGGAAGGALGAGAGATEAVGEGAIASSGGAVAADGTVFAAGEAIPAGTTLSSGSAFTTAGDVFGGYSASGSAAGTASGTVNSGFAASGVGQAAYDAAIANGSSQAAAQNAADAAYKSYLVIGGSGQTAGLTAGEDLAQLMKSYPNLSQSQLESIMSINYGTDPIVSADAANLANAGYNADAINQVLGYSYNPTELAGTGIDSSALNPSSGLNLSDTLKAAKNAKNGLNIAKLLTQGAASGLTKSVGQLAQGANPMGTSQLQIVRGNQNPFVYTPQQPIQDTKQAQLAGLLRQG